MLPLQLPLAARARALEKNSLHNTRGLLAHATLHEAANRQGRGTPWRQM